MTSDQARTTATKMLGRAPDHVEAFGPPVGGDDSYSFRLWLGRRTLLLKVKKRPDSPVGVYFHDRVKAAGVPVPELVAFSANAGPGGQACAIWQWIDGRPVHWGPSEPCPYDEAEFGELLRRIHDLRCDGPFGCLGDDPSDRTFSYTPDLPPTSRTWSGYFRFDLAAKRFRDKGYFDRHEADVLASLPDRLSGELDRAQPRLLHMGDVMHHGNMILHPRTGRILAVLDYVESMVGDPRWELAWLDYYFSQCPFNGALFDMARFRAAYGTNHDPDDPVGRFYLAAVLLFEKLLSAKPDDPPGRWAIETVKDIIKRSVHWARPNPTEGRRHRSACGQTMTKESDMRYGLELPPDAPYDDRVGFPAQSSVLDEDVLFHRVVGDYDIPAATRCRFFCRGDSDIYRVHTAGARFYLKVYRPPQSLAQAEAEARFVAGLHAGGAPVVPAVRRREGAYACQVRASEGPRPILLFAEAPPSPVSPVDADTCRALGTAVARLHEAADALEQVFDLPRFDCDWVLGDMMPYAKRHVPPDDYAYLQDLGARLRPLLDALPSGVPDFGLCHKDLVLSNVRQADDGTITFFDFGNAAYTWRAYELAVVSVSLSHRQAHGGHKQIWDAFRQGYASVRALPAATDGALPLFALLRRVMWLSGVLASCPLRMGTENFADEFVSKALARIRELAASIPALEKGGSQHEHV